MARAKLTSVRFLKGHRSYNSGEVAGFDPVLAGKLVKAGVAAYANKPGPKAEPRAEPEKTTPEPEDKPKAKGKPKGRRGRAATA